MTNITFSADDALIEAAREQARARNTSLNAEFRRWLESYARREEHAQHAMATIDRIRTYARTGGRRFTREEMNER